jgi:hypothetical protein
MALDYTASAELMRNGAFIDRVKVACLKYADFIMNEAVSVPAHSSRIRWAQTTVQSPDGTAQSVTPPVVMDTKVQIDGAAITDANLQSAVETTINRLM